MTDLTGIHSNAQAQSSTSAADISKLAEKMAEGLTEATLDGLVHAFQTIQNLRKNKKEEEEELPDYACRD
jgi:molecular chaperone GrpE (heat shock protein)